jgi:hypothetical protein
MADDTTPYIAAKPGDLVTSENWNGVQVDIKKDIQSSIQDAEKKIKSEGVDKAKDAEKFASKAPTDWTNDLDQRYVLKTQYHDSQTIYRKYYRRFTSKITSAFIEHKLGQFPLVDIYELMPFPSIPLPTPPEDDSDTATSTDLAKFVLYYEHEDLGMLGLEVQTLGGDRKKIGIPLKKALMEYGVKWEEDDSLDDVRGDLWNKISNPPNSAISHASSPWIKKKCDEGVTAERIMRKGEWDDIYLALMPAKCSNPSCLPTRTRVDNNTTSTPLKITHIDYDTILVEVMPDTNLQPSPQPPLDVMLLLRI